MREEALETIERYAYNLSILRFHVDVLFRGTHRGSLLISRCLVPEETVMIVQQRDHFTIISIK